MTEQIVECCICLDDIIGNKNKTITECGHIFHCSCLMTNTAHNGFGCPYCRTAMAEPINDDDESDDDYSEDDDDDAVGDDDDTLISFRMFQQRISGEDIEDEPEPEENIDDGEDEIIKPTPDYISQKLIEQGVSFNDIIKCLLVEHDEYDNTDDIEKISDEMFGKLRIIISNYTRAAAIN